MHPIIKEKILIYNPLTSVAGIPIVQNRSEESTVKELAEFLSEFQLNSALILIGKFSSLLSNRDELYIINKSEKEGADTFIYYGVLAYLALRLIEYADDANEKQFSEADLLKAIWMYNGLPEVHTTGEKGLDTILRQHNAQFLYEHPLGYLVARTLTLYRDLWSRLPEIPGLDLNEAIGAISGGLALEELLILGQFFWKAFETNRGLFRLNAFFDSMPIPRGDGTFINTKKVSAFLQWVTADYSTIRVLAENQTEKLEHPDLEKYRFNPLITYPIINPFRNPAGKLPWTYIAPLPHLILRRVTVGLYFNLLDYFKDRGLSGEFGKKFGKLWEMYVLFLLASSKLKGKPEGERIYQKRSIKRPDAIMLEIGKPVYIEAKLGSVYFDSKRYGDPKVTRDNLKKTIAHGIEQLWEFEDDIVNGNFPELADLQGFIKKQRVIALYDDISYGNSFIRDLSIEALKENDEKRVQEGKQGLNVPADFIFHILSIVDLENLCAVDGLSLFDFLEQKSVSPENLNSEMANYRNASSVRNEILDSILAAHEAPLLLYEQEVQDAIAMNREYK